DVDATAELHHVTDGRFERGACALRRHALAELHTEGERVLVALATHHDLVALDPANLPHHLIGLPRVDEHAAHLRHLVGAAAPPEHPRGRAAARTPFVGHDGEIAGAEADHRIRAVVDGRDQLANLSVR